MTQQAPRIGVGAVILDSDNRLLLVYRNREPEKGTWSIPGGKVDPYEPLEQTVVREIREEVDLDVQVERLLCMAETIRPERGEHWISAIYVTRIVSAEARNREEGGAIGAIGWFALDELPENLACFTVPAVEKLLGEARSQA